MPWSSSSAARTGHIVPRRQKLQDDIQPPAASVVNARIQASRLQAQRNSGIQPSLTGSDLRNLASSGDYAQIFDRAEEVQAEVLRKKRVAGPDAPLSWRRLYASRTASGKASPSQSVHPQTGFRPDSLREECLCVLLKDLATDGVVIDEVPVLPSSLKEALLNLAPRVAPLDDISADALLGDPYAIGADDAAAGAEGEDWEGPLASPSEIDTQMTPSSLNLSYSRISIQMLFELLVRSPSESQRRPYPAFPSLRALDLSRSSIGLTPSFIAVCAPLSLTSLSMVSVHYALATPLAALADALPTLRKLDLSQNSWLVWQHISDPDWSKQWTALESLTLSGCEKLTPQPSYLDPDGTPGGPGAVVQATSIIRERGRKRWIEIVM